MEKEKAEDKQGLVSKGYAGPAEEFGLCPEDNEESWKRKDPSGCSGEDGMVRVVGGMTRDRPVGRSL